MNEYDSNRILDLTKKINYVPTKNKFEANCYILNTCHIREKATEKVYHDIGRIKKEFKKRTKPIEVASYRFFFKYNSDRSNSIHRNIKFLRHRPY